MTSSLEKQLIIVNKRGLHARASAKFAKEAGRFDATLSVAKDGVAVTATSIMGLMMLGAAKGDTILVKSEGVQSAEAIAAIAALVEDGFNEPD